MINKVNLTLNDNVNQDYGVFNLVDPTSNDKFLLMNKKDKEELIKRIDKFYLEKREILPLKDNHTVGLELEIENARKLRIGFNMKIKFSNWYFDQSDGSLSNKGAEVNSPILTNTKEDWEELDKVCKLLRKYSVVNDNCGGHIHMGAHVLGNDKKNWTNFIKLWSSYEDIIYRFTNGEYLDTRSAASSYAKPLAPIWDYILRKVPDNFPLERTLFYVQCGKSNAVNLFNVLHSRNFGEAANRNTIEFRSPNGTLNSVIWQNNTNVFANLISYAKCDSFNEKLIDEQREVLSKLHSYKFSPRVIIESYNYCDIDKAIEFSDLIFDNNLDKIYFLKQYVKSNNSVKQNQKKLF